jgi:hypothetical protein
MASRERTKDVIRDRIVTLAATAETAEDALAVLRLAEAYAWVVMPDNAHGGSAA